MHAALCPELSEGGSRQGRSSCGMIGRMLLLPHTAGFRHTLSHEKPRDYTTAGISATVGSWGTSRICCSPGCWCAKLERAGSVVLASTGRECLAGRRPAPEQNTFEGLGLESISMQYTSPVFITEVCAQTLLSQVPGLWRTWRQVQESNHWHASCMPLGSCTR